MKKTLLLLAIIFMGVVNAAAQKINTVPPRKAISTTNVLGKPISTSTVAAQSAALNKAQILRKSAVSAKTRHSKRMAAQSKVATKPTNSIPTFKSRTPLMKFKAAVDTTFHEGFEAYDGTTKDWIPANWSELNKTGNAYLATDSVNSTWSVNSDNGYALTPEGQSMAWIDWDETPKAQDEWLISPAFTPVAGDVVSFDFFYNPFYMYYDWDNSTTTTNVFKFNAPNATLQLYVSTNNGANWVKVWDAMDDASQFNDINIVEFEQLAGLWNTIIKNLDAYVGQSIKIAFCYVGTDGDSMGLDNISIRQLSPTAFYTRPQGYFYAGLTPGYGGISYDLLVGPAYQDATWNNYSNAESETFSWTFEDPQNNAATISSSDVEPTVFYPAGEYKVPSLTAANGAKSSTYSWGNAAPESYFLAGGSPGLGLGNYDLSEKFQLPYFGADDYCFGTGPGKEVDAIANYYDKPVHRYLLDSVWINLGEFAAPAGTEFKLIIHRVAADGSLTDTIATSVCLAQDVTQPQTGYYTMMFKGFTSFDPVTELDITNDYLEISDAILVELTGFNIPGVTLAAFSQIIDSSPTGESNAYVFYLQNAQRGLIGGSDYIGATSLLMNLGATYSYIAADDTEFVAPVEGGNKLFNVDTWYSPSDWWTDVELPAWLKIDTVFNEVDWTTTLTFTAEPLPANIVGRGANILFTTYGADMNIFVKQGVYVGLKDVKALQTKVSSREGAFELSYTSNFDAVAIYNVAGQVIGNYKLPTTGTLSIPNINWNKGIYIFKFGGKQTETTKAIR